MFAGEETGEETGVDSVISWGLNPQQQRGKQREPKAKRRLPSPGNSDHQETQGSLPGEESFPTLIPVRVLISGEALLVKPKQTRQGNRSEPSRRRERAGCNSGPATSASLRFPERRFPERSLPGEVFAGRGLCRERGDENLR